VTSKQVGYVLIKYIVNVRRPRMANTDIPMIIGAFFSNHVRWLEGGSVGRDADGCCSF